MQADDISWQEYEYALLQKLRHEFQPYGFRVYGTEKGKKHYRRGRFSLVKRQLDAAVYRLGEDTPLLVADAKSFNRELDVKDVECFIGMMEDVGARIGLLMAPEGFTAAATRRASAASLTVKIMSVNEALEYKWIPLARSIYPWDWIFHLELAKSIKRLKEGAVPSCIVDALESIAFEEWEACVEYALVHHHREAVQTLETIAVQHYDDGWRYNAVRILSECGELGSTIVERVRATEQDAEVLELLEVYCVEGQETQ